MMSSNNPAESYEVIAASGALPKKKRGVQTTVLETASDSSDSDREKDVIINDHSKPLPDHDDTDFTGPKPKKIMAPYLWSKDEDDRLAELVSKMERWTEIARSMPNRTARQCRLRWNRLLLNSNSNIKTGPWTDEEDALVVELVSKHGQKWAEIAAEMQTRTAEQIRGRYTISLIPERMNGSWSREEHRIILDMHAALGNRWTDIAKHLPGRVNKQVGSHYYEAVMPRLNLYLKSINKNDYKELTEEEIEQLINFLQVKRSSSTVSIHKKLNVDPRRVSPYHEARPGAPKLIRKTKAQLRAEADEAAGVTTSSGGGGGDTTKTSQNKRPRNVTTKPNTSAVTVPSSLSGNSGLLELTLAGDSSDESDHEGAGEHELVHGDSSGSGIKRARIIFTEEEDAMLKDLAARRKPWTYIAKAVNKTARQCRVRYTVVLNPDIKTGSWTEEEDALLQSLMEQYGHQWTDISLLMKNRTAEQVRGRYNCNKRSKREMSGYHTAMDNASSSSSSAHAVLGVHQPILLGDNEMGLLEELSSMEEIEGAGQQQQRV